MLNNAMWYSAICYAAGRDIPAALLGRRMKTAEEWFDYAWGEEWADTVDAIRAEYKAAVIEAVRDVIRLACVGCSLGEVEDRILEAIGEACEVGE